MELPRRRDFARDPAVLPLKAPDLIVARTILEQLGGQRFVVMTGAKNFIGGPDSLSFKIPKTRRIRGVRITRTPADTYTVEFFTWGRRARQVHKVRRTREQKDSGGRYGCLDTVATVEDVYAGQLRDVFTRVTGLQTSLPIVIR
jgi:hypothetical protein